MQLKWFAFKFSMILSLISLLYVFCIVHIYGKSSIDELKISSVNRTYKTMSVYIIVNGSQDFICKSDYHPIFQNEGYWISCQDNSMWFTSQPFIMKES